MELNVLSNHLIGGRYGHLSVGFSDALKEVSSGQFLMIRVLESTDPLLLRPMSILRNDPLNGSAQILYKIHGRGTQILSKKRKDDPIEVIGPLGKGFTLMEESTHLVLVGGGIGIPPLIHLAEAIEREDLEIEAFIGGQSSEDIFGEEDLTAAGAEVTVSTIDGSEGFQGLVTVPFEDKIRTADPAVTMVYCCGPTPMLKRVGEICLNVSVPCQLSVETMMGCGFGVCLGCAVLTRKPEGLVYQRSCTEGPVFYAGDLVLERL